MKLHSKKKFIKDNNWLNKAKHASPIDQLLIDEEYADTKKLTTCSKVQDLEKIADYKQAGPFQAWKFNQQKTLSWLEKKVSRISQHLKDSNFNVTQSTISANYVKAAAAIVPESNSCKHTFFPHLKSSFRLLWRFQVHLCDTRLGWYPNTYLMN